MVKVVVGAENKRVVGFLTGSWTEAYGLDQADAWMQSTWFLFKMM